MLQKNKTKGEKESDHSILFSLQPYNNVDKIIINNGNEIGHGMLTLDLILSSLTPPLV